MTEPTQNPWDHQADEPGLWFARFRIYLARGPERSIEAAYRESRLQMATHSSKKDAKGRERTHRSGARSRPSAQWREVARRWRWADRALAFDAHSRDLSRSEHERARAEAARFSGPMGRACRAATEDPVIFVAATLTVLSKYLMDQGVPRASITAAEVVIAQRGFGEIANEAAALSEQFRDEMRSEAKDRSTASIDTQGRA